MPVNAGGGKSLVFQLPAVVTNTSVVVISPLLALAKDQVRALMGLGSAPTLELLRKTQ